MCSSDLVPWARQLADSHELVTHEVTTTTLSAEITAYRLAAVDLLKIDVEGFFLEVLGGIAEPDFARIGNIVIEIDYAAEAGAGPDDVARLLEAKGYCTKCEDLMFYAWRGG